MDFEMKKPVKPLGQEGHLGVTVQSGTKKKTKFGSLGKKRRDPARDSRRGQKIKDILGGPDSPRTKESKANLEKVTRALVSHRERPFNPIRSHIPSIMKALAERGSKLGYLEPNELVNVRQPADLYPFFGLEAEQLFQEFRQLFPRNKLFDEYFGETEQNGRRVSLDTDERKSTQRTDADTVDSGDLKRNQLIGLIVTKLNSLNESELSSAFDLVSSIVDRAAAIDALPRRLWAGAPRGGGSKGSAQALVDFIREVYGPLLVTHRDEVRQYIYRHDPKLYQAIVNYERHAELPSDIALPKRGEAQRVRSEQAASGVRASAPAERRSVLGRT